MLSAKANEEVKWINKILDHSSGKLAVVEWTKEDLRGEKLYNIQQEKMKKTKIAFVCVHNSCRSQIAEALTKKFACDSIEVYSAGTELKDQINQDAVRLVKEIYGLDMEETQKPKLLNDIPEVDYLITMGCNVVCPILPYTVKKDDQGLEDPSGKNDEEFIKTINEIESKVHKLIAEVEAIKE